MSVSQLRHFFVQKAELGEKFLMFSMSKLDNLRFKLNNCGGCRLKKTRTRVVFGEGNCRSRLLLIGEAPGYYEDKQGQPFVGEAGQLLTEILDSTNLKRSDIYITNLVKCRPPDNRDPRPDEIKICATFLEIQIMLLQPKIVVCLGRFSSQHILKCNTPIHSIRGKVHGLKNFKVIPAYHPAFIIRNPAQRKYLHEDLKLAERLLNEELSAAQTATRTE